MPANEHDTTAMFYTGPFETKVRRTRGKKVMYGVCRGPRLQTSESERRLPVTLVKLFFLFMLVDNFKVSILSLGDY